MSRRLKTALARHYVAVAWITGVVIFVLPLLIIAPRIWQRNAPRDYSVDVWTPPQAQVMNHQNEHFFLAENVVPSGTIVYYRLDHYKKMFADKPQQMTLTDDGLGYYLTKQDGVTYATIVDYAPNYLEHVSGFRDNKFLIHKNQDEDRIVKELVAPGIMSGAIGFIVAILLSCKLVRWYYIYVPQPD